MPPAAAVPVAPATTSASSGAGDYVVNIGSFGNTANAQALVQKLRASGLPVIADRVTIGGGSGLRVRVGPYADRAAAEAARLRAETVAGSSGKVVVLDAPARLASVAAKPPVASKPVNATPAATPAAVAGAGFAVQLSAPSVEADANALRDRARGAGFSSFVQRVDTDAGVRYRVRVGPFADRASAVAALAAVNGKLGSKGIVVRHP